MKATKILALAVFAAASASASADTLNLTNYVYTPAQSFQLVGTPRGTVTYGVGEFTGTLNGNSFQTFCLDLGQSMSFGTTYTDYSVQSGASLLGATEADRLGKLYTNYIGSVTDATTSAAFQLAAWEIITETGSALDLTSGSFYTTTSGTAVSTANTWLSGLDSKTSAYTIDVLYSSSHQDQLVATPVPEPETYAMMGAGLALMGAIARRRKHAK